MDLRFRDATMRELTPEPDPLSRSSAPDGSHNMTHIAEVGRHRAR